MKISNHKKIDIVEMFIKFKNIPEIEISIQLNVSSSLANRIITKYLNDKCLILESKINPIKTKDSRKVLINGLTYNSAKEASEILGIKQNTIYKRKVFVYK